VDTGEGGGSSWPPPPSTAQGTRERDGATDGGDGVKDAGKTLDDRTASQAVTIMTTEHYALQGVRAATIADASGRASLYLGSVSSALVALAFIGQVSRDSTGLGEAFYVFGIVLFPSLFFLGLVTFERVLQSAIEDTIAVHGINRIRHYYAEIAPQLEPYFVESTHDDVAGAMQNMGASMTWWQSFLDTAGMIAVINSVIAGVSTGLVASRLAASRSITPFVLIGGVAFLVSLGLHQRHQVARWRRTDARLPVLFPSPKSECPAASSRRR